MSKVQSKNAILYDIGNDAGPLRDAIVDAIGEGTTTDSGLLSTADKTKLDGIAAGATANAADAALRDRTTHTGEQAIETITGLAAALAGKATPADVAAALAGLVDSSPVTLDTLNELAAALGDDPNFATTVSTALGNRLRVDAAQGLTAPQQAQGRDNLGLGSAATSATGDFATAAQGAKADSAVQPGDLEDVGVIGVENYSNPTAAANAVIYVKSTGTDTITGPLHGSTEATAFLTWEAAINHAKTFYKFVGRLSTVEFRFGAGSWGAISISSTLYQGDEYYPFVVRITSINDADRAEFTGITSGSWAKCTVHVKGVKAAYFSVTHANTMTVDNVSIINSASISYCFRAGSLSQLYIFGDIDVEEAVSFSSAFIYATDGAFISLENGDSPTIFPGFNLIGAANITSPYKYRIVLGSRLYCPANPYPMLTYASNYWVDAYSMSTQTQQGTDLENDAVGGPVVKRSGDTASGYRIYADGYCEQWGMFSLSSLAAGKTVSAATVTFDVAFASATYQIVFDSNNIGLRVGKNGSTTTTTCPVGAWNHEASAQSATVRWRAYGYI